MRIEDLDRIRNERQKWFEWKNIKPLVKKISKLNSINYPNYQIKFDNIIKISSEKKLSQKDYEKLFDIAKSLIPWRKGPFEVFDIYIDSEWQSFIKYNLLEPHLNLKNKIVADIGCNNGYYMFRMLKQNPKKIVGFDPSPLFKLQFDFINFFVKSDIKFELLGVEHIEFYEFKFDTIFLLGVLYHRSDPIKTLKSIYKSLNKGGELIIDNLIIEGDDDICLSPKDRYAMMKNIYFIPTIECFKNWLIRAGFKEVKILKVLKTTLNEQRKTSWSGDYSLNNFLDPNDENKTIEGYPAPIRAYLKAIK